MYEYIVLTKIVFIYHIYIYTEILVKTTYTLLSTKSQSTHIVFAKKHERFYRVNVMEM